MTFHAKRANPRGAPSPLVEAVTKHKGDWSVEDKDWGGSTNNLDHEMYVPLSDEPCAYCEKNHSPAIRGHELMHTKLSPESYGPITVQVGDKEIPVSSALVEVAEEYRINFSLAKVEGEGIIDNGWCHPTLQPGVFNELDQGKFTEVIKLAVAGGPGADRVLTEYLVEYREYIENVFIDKSTSEGVKKQIKKKLKVVEALFDAIPAYSAAAGRIMVTRNPKGLPSWSQTEQLAAFLEVNLKEFEKKLKSLMADPPPDLEKMRRMVDTYDEETRALNPEGKVEKHGEKLVMGEGKKGKTVEDVRWGRPDRTVEAKMPLSIPAWKLQKQNRAVDEGTVPRYMHRWPTDKRVFHRTRKLEGGTLLVDDSGSMGLTPEQLEEILDVVPLATVAVYAGRDQGDGGEIRIVAKDGKRAATEDLSIEEYGGNGIDGPALEWLGEQSYPRVWITDGGVTDKTFGFSKEVVEAATRLVLKHKITVARSAEEAADILKTGRLAR